MLQKYHISQSSVLYYSFYLNNSIVYVPSAYWPAGFGLGVGIGVGVGVGFGVGLGVGFGVGAGVGAGSTSVGGGVFMVTTPLEEFVVGLFGVVIEETGMLF